MPRSLRIQEAGYVHHVIARGNNGQTLFNFQQDYRVYVDLFEKARQLYPVKVYNFALMHNHVHFLVEPVDDGNLSKLMETVTKAYAKYFNKSYNHSGHVFQGRFKSFLVQEEKYFFTCSRYIDLNPVKARAATNPKIYSWSGYKYLAHGEEACIKVEDHELYTNMGSNPAERQIAYRAFVQMYQGEEIDLLERKAGVLGDKEFKKQIKGAK